MQKHWKLFTTSLILAFTLASPQAIQGIDKHEAAGAAAPLRQRTDYKANELHGGFQDGLPRELMQLCFGESSKRGADPRVVERVCKEWYNAMRYIIPNKGAPLADLAGIPYESKLYDFFMEDYMKLYMEGIVSRAAMYYKKGRAGEEQVIRFSDSPDGTADLSGCEDMGNYVVYTLNEDRLRVVGGANKCKVLVFFAPIHKARHLLPTDAVGKGGISDIVVIWRWGNDPGVHMIDYLIINPALLGVAHMYENWERSVMRRHVPMTWYPVGGGLILWYFMFNCEPKLRC